MNTRDESRYILLVFADQDGFKDINDAYGHDAGDEFVVAGSGAEENETVKDAADALRVRLATLLAGTYQLSSCVIAYPRPSIGTIAVNPALDTTDSALREADA